MQRVVQVQQELVELVSVPVDATDNTCCNVCMLQLLAPLFQLMQCRPLLQLMLVPVTADAMLVPVAVSIG
jgi:hypothetical protein